MPQRHPQTTRLWPVMMSTRTKAPMGASQMLHAPTAAAQTHQRRRRNLREPLLQTRMSETSKRRNQVTTRRERRGAKRRKVMRPRERRRGSRRIPSLVVPLAMRLLMQRPTTVQSAHLQSNARKKPSMDVCNHCTHISCQTQIRRQRQTRMRLQTISKTWRKHLQRVMKTPRERMVSMKPLSQIDKMKS